MHYSKVQIVLARIWIIPQPTKMKRDTLPPLSPPSRRNDSPLSPGASLAGPPHIVRFTNPSHESTSCSGSTSSDGQTMLSVALASPYYEVLAEIQDQMVVKRKQQATNCRDKTHHKSRITKNRTSGGVELATCLDTKNAGISSSNPGRLLLATMHSRKSSTCISLRHSTRPLE
jgi:hypothetical protein